MKMKRINDDRVVEVEEWFITKNGWEYYVIKDANNSKDLKLCLVLGYEQEMGDVYIPEIRPHLMGHTTKSRLSEILPAEGWQWVA